MKTIAIDATRVGPVASYTWDGIYYDTRVDAYRETCKARNPRTFLLADVENGRIMNMGVKGCRFDRAHLDSIAREIGLPNHNPMLPIPITAAERIAKDFGYDQVVIIARRVGDGPQPQGEHVTTYGVDKANCDVAALIGKFVRSRVMQWEDEE